MSSITSLFESQSASVEQVLAEIESQRKKSILPCFFWAIVAAGIITLISWAFCSFDSFALVICLLITVPASIYGCVCYYRGKLSDIYKSEVLPNLVKSLEADMKEANGTSFNYNPLCEVDPALYRNSQLFSYYDDDSAAGEDQIVGKIGKTDFNFCESSYSFTTTDSDGDSSTKTIFNGMIFDADFNKNFNGITLLAAKRPEGAHVSAFPEVKLESVEFSKIFKVFSTDQVEARYILTPALQERFVNLVKTIRQSTGENKMMVSFYNSRVLILIPSKVDHFEAKLFSPLKLERVKQDFQLIHDMIAIVNELNLNTRIWTKQ